MSTGRARVAVVALSALAAALATGPAAVANHTATDQISVGQINGNGPEPAGFVGASADGTRVFFATSEQLVSADVDTSQDIYERSGGTTTLISTGPSGGNGAIDASFAGASADGTHVFFTTSESLVPQDTDSGCIDPVDLTMRACDDIYERSGGTTTLVSTGPGGGNGAFDASFEGSSADGSHVFFTTDEPLVPADTDSGCSDPPDPTLRPCQDVYERFGGTTNLVSTGGSGSFDAFFDDSSVDGTRVFITTAERLAGSDTDSFDDVYQRSGGTTTPISTGPTGGNGTFDASFGRSSSDGSRVFIQTAEALTSGDTDSTLDVYERSGGTTTLLSTGPNGGNGPFDAGVSTVSSDGGHVFFATYESLVSADTDSSLDIYERSGGTTTLVSTGPTGGNGAFDVFYRGVTPDGTHVYFATAERLAASDTDSSQDVYEHSSGATTQVSVGQINGNGSYSAAFRDVSDDGARVFFTTRERLVSADSDPAPGSCVSSTCSQDVYERFGGTTYLISLGPALDNGNKNAVYNGESLDGTRVFYGTAKQQITSDTDTVQDVYQAGVQLSLQPSYEHPQSASPLSYSLVPVFRQCGTGANPANGAHAAPLSSPACTPTSTSGTAHVGTLASGTAALTVVPGNPSTLADEADVNVTAAMSDVRATSASGPDYNPNPGADLTLVAKWRITDLYNGPTHTDAGTATDFDFPVPISCQATVGSEGSNCNANTSADAVTPGSIPEGRAMEIATFRMRINDSGADGVRGNGDDKLFQQQGYYVP